MPASTQRISPQQRNIGNSRSGTPAALATGLDVPAANAEAERLLAASIDPARRGETLSIKNFVTLLQRSGDLPKPSAPVEPPVAEAVEAG